MQIAQVLAGYTLGGADLLRRAMGKKKPEEMAKQRSIFVDGAVARGVDQRQAAHIFDLMEKFAGYGFNKSHSAAYALLSYQTAYLKAHYPAAFMAAVLSADMDHTDKVVTLIRDCRDARARSEAAGRERVALRVHGRRRHAPSATGWAPCAAWGRARWRRSSQSARRTGRSRASRTCAAGSICRS